MQLQLNARLRRRVTLTPLIDIIFLLLLFFMLTSTFSQFSEIELVGAGLGSGSALTAPIFVQLQVDRLRVNGDDVPLDDLRTRLQALAESGSRTVLLSLDEQATSQSFVDVYAVARSMPNLNVAVIE